MKKRRPVKHAHRRVMIAQRKAKGKYSKVHLPKICSRRYCGHCWANGTQYCPFNEIFNFH